MTPSVLPSDLRGQVAQSVEQEPEKLRVGGSIPSLPTRFAGALHGWWLVAWIALIVGGMSGAIVVSGGITPEAPHALLRATARTSLALFLDVFVAAPLQQIRQIGRASCRGRVEIS